MTQTATQNGSMFLRYTYAPFGNVESINAPMVVDIDDLNRYTYNGEIRNAASQSGVLKYFALWVTLHRHQSAERGFALPEHTTF